MPVLWIDDVYEKIRAGKHVKSMAVTIVKAINMEGKPEIIAVEDMENESKGTYTEFFNKLKARGLEKVWLCVSDAHTGLQADTKENALKAYDKFIETFETKYAKAVENLKKDKEELFRFYDYPAEHWTHIRTSNPIESIFATVRLRRNSTKGNETAKATEAMAFKL